jgi:uncharacterized DUF497 family protein
MEFEWDEAKNRSNIGKHGIDFADAEAVFDGVMVRFEDDRYEYGETRERAIGMLANGFVVMLVFTTRDGRVRLISARPASRFERKKYEEALQ